MLTVCTPCLPVQLPAPFNLQAVMKSKQDDPSPLHVVLFQEVRWLAGGHQAAT